MWNTSIRSSKCNGKCRGTDSPRFDQREQARWRLGFLILNAMFWQLARLGASTECRVVHINSRAVRNSAARRWSAGFLSVQGIDPSTPQRAPVAIEARPSTRSESPARATVPLVSRWRRRPRRRCDLSFSESDYWISELLSRQEDSMQEGIPDRVPPSSPRSDRVGSQGLSTSPGTSGSATRRSTPGGARSGSTGTASRSESRLNRAEASSGAAPIRELESRSRHPSARRLSLLKEGPDPKVGSRRSR